MQTGNIDYIYKNDLDKVLRNKAFKIASNPKYDGCQRRLVSIVFKFLDEKSSGRGVMWNKQLAVELYKPIIRKFKRIKIYS